MSEHMELTSLVGLAGGKGQAVREGPDSRTLAATSKATRKGGFEGFLNTFLGRDKQSWRKSSVSSDNQSLAASLPKDKAEASKQPEEPAADRNTDDEPAKTPLQDILFTPAELAEMAAAADEAARLIWGILYGNPEGLVSTNLEGGSDQDPVSRLAALLEGLGQDAGNANPLSSLGAGGVDAEALRKAMETANASAEMNNVAVLSALEELVEGMPRQALEEALARTAEEMGLDSAALPGDIINELAKVLHLEILTNDFSGSGAKGLLAELARMAAESGDDRLVDVYAGGGQNSAPGTAETSGTLPLERQVYDLFKEFLKGKTAENPAGGSIFLSDSELPKAAQDLLDEFANWLRDNHNNNEINILYENKEKLGQVLISAWSAMATDGGKDASTGFFKIPNNLEKILHFYTSMKSGGTTGMFSDAALGTPESAMTSGTSETGKDVGAQAGTGGVAALATAGTIPTGAGANASNQSTVSTMLDQIENIERLTEAMRMANKNGVKNLTLQLSPPELGKVMLRVVSRDGVVSAYLRVEKPEAASQLMTNLAQLRDNLKAQGIELGELDIRQQHDQAASDFSGHRQHRDAEGASDTEGNQRSGRHAEDSEDGQPEGDGLPDPGPKPGGGLNLVA